MNTAEKIYLQQVSPFILTTIPHTVDSMLGFVGTVPVFVKPTFSFRGFVYMYGVVNEDSSMFIADNDIAI